MTARVTRPICGATRRVSSLDIAEIDMSIEADVEMSDTPRLDKGKQRDTLDNLPWVEKYRPATLDDVVAHQDIISTIDQFIAKNRFPHLLLYGPPGTGKTSTILAVAKKIYPDAALLRNNCLEVGGVEGEGRASLRLTRTEQAQCIG